MSAHHKHTQEKMIAIIQFKMLINHILSSVDFHSKIRSEHLKRTELSHYRK